MRYEDYEPLGRNVLVTMSLNELAVMYSAAVDAFGKMTEQSPFWKETEKLISDISEIIKKATDEKKMLEDYARANR